VNPRGTSKFVKQLLDEWLKIITDSATLDQIVAQVEARRKQLRIESKEQAVQRLLDEYKLLQNEFAPGAVTLNLIKPLSRPEDGPLPPSSLMPPPKRQRNEYKRWQERMQVKFWMWQPRKKRLWVLVAWKTRYTRKGHNFLPLSMKDIKVHQPSRTEADIRLKQSQ